MKHYCIPKSTKISMHMKHYCIPKSKDNYIRCSLSRTSRDPIKKFELSVVKLTKVRRHMYVSKMLERHMYDYSIVKTLSSIILIKQYISHMLLSIKILLIWVSK